MITLVFTYRNRDISIVKKCFESLQNQTNKAFEVTIVNYGSSIQFSTALELLVKQYSFIKLIDCPVQNQLWNKSRAINIVLKECQNPYFFVGDIDMIFREDFIEKLNQLKSAKQAVYFKVGYLNKEESIIKKKFEDYRINHFSTFEATGMTLYSTALLKEINGYDEFYHGWGAEDTDVHYRLKNNNIEVKYFDQEVLMLHQWHPKQYRDKKSKLPFHTKLEQINYSYIHFNNKQRITKANTTTNWGIIPNSQLYKVLENPMLEIEISNEMNDFDAFVLGGFQNFNDVLSVKVLPSINNTLKNRLKKILGKKHYSFYTFEEVNNKLLELIITRYRNYPYNYSFDQVNKIIHLKIALQQNESFSKN